MVKNPATLQSPVLQNVPVPVDANPQISEAPDRPAAPLFPFFDMSNDMQQYVLHFTHFQDLTSFGSASATSNKCMHTALIKKAESFGYKGLDYGEAKKYVQDFLTFLKLLLDKKMIVFEGGDAEDLAIYLSSKDTEFIYNLYCKMAGCLVLPGVEILSKYFLHLIESKIIRPPASNSKKCSIQLTFASKLNYKYSVSLLLALGVDPNLPNSTLPGLPHLNLPLVAAARRGLNEIVTLLLNAGAEVDKLTGNSSALGFALWPLLKSDQEQVFATVKTQEQVFATVKILLEHGADPHRMFRGKYLPLQLASTYHTSKLVELLIKHGARVNDAGPGTNSVLNCVFEGIDGKSKREEIINKVRLLLEHGANVNFPAHNGSKPLHWAAQQGLDEVVQLLLDHGARIDDQSIGGVTPLCFALGAGFIKKPQHEILATVQILLRKGANLNIGYGYQHILPIHLAAKFGFDEIIMLLWEQGVNIKAPDAGGRTPMYYATKKKRASTITLLSMLDE